jgi:hypothetical protein
MIVQKLCPSSPCTYPVANAVRVLCARDTEQGLRDSG